MSSARHVAGFAEELTCAICLDLFKDPVILECGHDFCRACIGKVWDSQQEGPQCPLCKRALSGRKCTPNEVLASLTQRVLAQRESCGLHDEKFRLFCLDDGELACTVCRDAPAHASHSFLPIQDAVQVYKEQVKCSLAPMKSQIRDFQGLIAKQEQTITSLRENNLALERHIADEFEKLHQFLRKREQALKNELNQKGAALRREMELRLETFRERLRKTEEMVSTTQAKLEQQNSIVFLADIKSFFDMFHGRQKEAVPVQNVVSEELSLGQFKGPIQYMAWKEMMKSLTPGVSCLTLDPESAHPVLHVSKDLTSVDYRPKAVKVTDNPKRFECSVCIVGSKGFTAGRHYWEVEVGNKADWEVGVARKSSKRKGVFKLKPEDGYWTIGRAKDNTYTALDSPSKVLQLPVRPERIGVYLDYEGEQLSFYNAKNRSHIYTFHSSFKEALYAFFSPCANDSKPLTIFYPKV